MSGLGYKSISIYIYILNIISGASRHGICVATVDSVIKARLAPDHRCGFTTDPCSRGSTMSSSFMRKLPLCQALICILLLLLGSPVCLSSSQSSSWVSAWGSAGAGSPGAGSPGAGSPGAPLRVRRQLHLRNEWASWSGWSMCSRTCGGGASVRTRTCITRNPVGGPCAGEPRQYKICNTKECAPGSEDFREMQCAAFNDRPLVAGIAYRWTTFSGGSNPCELSCLAHGHNFYFNFGRVLDGTSCSKEPGAVCVNGRCLMPGCDYILGSDQQEDACMVCGGQNSSCLHHKSVYQSTGQEAGGALGYNEVAMIPAGATHIRVTDNSRNYLALQNGHSQFVINGHWKISVPGEYSVAGTKLLYRRSADTWESFEVSGPTHEDLHVMVLATDSNPGIEYEYWLPPDRYNLYHGRRSPLRQPHHTSYLPWEQPPSTTTTTTSTTTSSRPQPVSVRPKWVHPGGRPAKPKRPTSSHDRHRPSHRPSLHPSLHQPILPRLEREDSHRNLLPHSPPDRYCGKCRRVRGRGERQRQYCTMDFVFRGKVMGKLYRGEETRYDVQVLHTYRNRYRLEHREFLWVSNVCDCPHLEPGRQYVLMVRRHINHERTLDRILLEEGSFATPYRPREDALLRPLEGTCSDRGTKRAAELRGWGRD